MGAGRVGVGKYTNRKKKKRWVWMGGTCQWKRRKWGTEFASNFTRRGKGVHKN